MKKNLMIIVPSLSLGGQQRVAISTAEILKDDFNITFVYFDDSNAVYKTGCNTINLSIPATEGMFFKYINQIRRAQKLRQLKIKLHIDIAYSFGSTANLSNVLSKDNELTVISIHGYRTAASGSFCKFVYNRADLVLGVSKQICGRVISVYPSIVGKTKCLYNPYDIKEIVKKSREPVPDFDFSKRTIVTHGRLHEVKNYNRLIKAFSIAHRHIDDIQLLIIGEGEERNNLQNLIDKLGLTKCVSLIGFRENPYAYISKSALYVLSSFNEGFPNCLIEGMTFLPVVSVDCLSGPREILYKNNEKTETIGYRKADYGILVQPTTQTEPTDEFIEDDNILADAIISLLNNDSELKKFKDLASQRVWSFGYDAYKDSFISIVNNIDYDKTGNC